MTPEWKKLEDKIKEAIRSHQTSPPVSVSNIARDLNLKVKSATLKPGVSGEILPSQEEAGRFIIRVNRHEVQERQRFTVAHEISHFILHKEEIRKGITDNTLYRSNLSDRREHQANRLAAEILMPWHLIEQELEDGKITPDELAEKFRVSTTAMKIRLGIPT